MTNHNPEIEILTVGHSTLTYKQFLALLRQASINAIADVRTHPYSKHFPQFNREELSSELRHDHIRYVFLGGELGGRPKEDRFFCDGIADYEEMAQATSFKEGLDRVIKGAKKYRIALMCSEHDPLDCHRCLLVGRALAERGASVKHIKSNGDVANHHDIEERLLRLEGQQGDDLFVSRGERLAAAYKKHARKVAYSKPSSKRPSHVAAE